MFKFINVKIKKKKKKYKNNYIYILSIVNYDLYYEIRLI